MNMITFIHGWLSTKAQADSERGAGLAEYALLGFLIALACLTALTTLGTTISGVFDDITAAL